ncbi:MAG: hypothetical protein HYZ28_04555 [Myxococcales bacterium]|nr:hypothetical protein [Myxococcales bacterium]
MPLEARGCPSAERPAAGLRLIRGEGAGAPEKLCSRDAVIRALMETGADLLLRRISVERAEEIESNVERILDLFDRTERVPKLLPALRRELDELEALMRDSRAGRFKRRSR